MEEQKTDKKQEYNDEPVYYCSKCLSLAVVSLDDIDYCNNCGSADIESDSIENWEMMYLIRYGEKFIQKNREGEK